MIERTWKHYLKHAERHGTEGVYEAAAEELPKRELDTLARHMAKLPIDPSKKFGTKWRLPREYREEVKNDPA